MFSMGGNLSLLFVFFVVSSCSCNNNNNNQKNLLSSLFVNGFQSSSLLSLSSWKGRRNIIKNGGAFIMNDSSNNKIKKKHSFVLSSSNTDKDKDRSYFEKQRQELMDMLVQIDTLQSTIESSSSSSSLEKDNNDHKKNDDDYINTYNTVQQLNQKVSKVIDQTLIPPNGLSLKEYEKAIQLYVSLPYMIRQGLCQSLEQDEENDNNNTNNANEYQNLNPKQTLMNAPQIITQLYNQRYQLTPAKLQSVMETIQKQQPQPVKVKVLTEEDLALRGLSSSSMSSSNANSMDQEEFVQELLGGQSVEQLGRDNVVKQQLPRQITGGSASNLQFDTTSTNDNDNTEEKEISFPTVQNVDTFMNLLTANDEQKVFIPQGKPEPIPGGYVIRGTPATKSSTGRDLMEQIDTKLTSTSASSAALREFNEKCQVCYLQDFTSEGINMEVSSEGIVTSSNPVLVVLAKDMSSQTNSLIKNSSTLLALVSIVLFGIGCFAGNEEIALRLNELNAVGDTSGLNWFNGLLADLVIPLFVIQGMHELGHFLIANKDKMKVSPPTLLPFYVLPLLGTNTQLKESPKDINSLFDFAFLGPFAGIVTSLIFLIVGLQTTILADGGSSSAATAAAMQYYPTLPVDIINYSALGGYLVDTFLGGTDGIITSQDLSTVVKLHPYAISGYIGLIVNCLDLLPLGSTDGGRLSQSIFGRSGHLFVGGATWTALLLSTILIPHHDVLVGAWVMNNVIQNDMEIPARNEVDGLTTWRAILGFSIWIFAFLTLYPIGSY
mmetsp:Transcript_6615/g.9355  ORF Transcript_6615/g.9355 Transcript_6615/m.9355 type:complete len:775 (-) Transcript_6615:362-2686(-)